MCSSLETNIMLKLMFSDANRITLGLLLFTCPLHQGTNAKNAIVAAPQTWHGNTHSLRTWTGTYLYSLPT